MRVNGDRVEARLTEYGQDQTYVEVKVMSLDNSMDIWLKRMGFSFSASIKRYTKTFNNKNSLDTFINFITDNTIYKITATKHQQTTAHAYFSGRILI